MVLVIGEGGWVDIVGGVAGIHRVWPAFMIFNI